MPSIKPFSSHPDSLLQCHPIPPETLPFPLSSISFPSIQPLISFQPPAGHTGLLQGPVTSSVQVNHSSQFSTKLNFALINNAHPLLPYEDSAALARSEPLPPLLFSHRLCATVKTTTFIWLHHPTATPSGVVEEEGEHPAGVLCTHANRCNMS